MSTKVFPVLIIILQAAASLVYASYGDWRRSVYWGAATILTAAVTF